ncbi:hypothetical protein Dda_0246 [Drechslerella dactyloides]|uniref:Uncharacterized protein n=1 Tax=Drechslerella dactyloides TaxID=74499 RepID=A0AAD6J468_DREDA|nr:hypothetical protein Dda_0246 [Drechslerella dactyloides]
MAKRKRAGKKNYHEHTAPTRSTPSEQQPYPDDSHLSDDLPEDVPEGVSEDVELEDYVWDSKPLKSSRAGLSATGSRGYVDPTTNQRGAFPELQGADDAVDLSRPAIDGLSYLRMVRHEARGVPNLLTASQTPVRCKVAVSAIVIAAPTSVAAAITERPIPENVDALLYDDDNVAAYTEQQASALPPAEEPSQKSGRLSYGDDQQFGYEDYNNTYDDEDDDDDDEWPIDPYDSDSDSDSSAYYDDGAYIARSAPTIPTAPTTPGILPPREISPSWHTSLLSNFHSTRDAILTTPQDPSDTTTFPANPTLWRDYMIANNPSLPLLQNITSEIAIKALKHIRKNLGWVNVNEWQGQWVWSLLARTNDVGVLMNEEVSVLRELGKKAVFNLGKAADARGRIVAAGGADWWDEKMQREVMEYMNGGGRSASQMEAGDGERKVQVDERVEAPVVSPVETDEERPAKKAALFRPRSVVVNDKAVAKLAVPTISVTPATPKAEEDSPKAEEEKEPVQSPEEDSEAPPAVEVDTMRESPAVEIDAAMEQTPETKIDTDENLPIVADGSGRKEVGGGEAEDGDFQETVAPRIPDVKTMFALDMIYQAFALSTTATSELSILKASLANATNTQANSNRPLHLRIQSDTPVLEDMATPEPTTPTSTSAPSTPPQTTTPDPSTSTAPAPLPAHADPSTPPQQTLPSSATVERTRAREDTPVRLPPQSIGKPPKTPDFRSLLKSAGPKFGSANSSNAGVPKSAPPGMRRFDVAEGSRIGSHATGSKATPRKASPFTFNESASATTNSKKQSPDDDTADDDAAKIGVVQWDSSDEEDSRPSKPR